MTGLMASGVELMLIGMGIVFLFLTMLVIAIDVMSALVQRFFPEPPASAAIPVPSASATDKAAIAAISAAIHQYRDKHKP